MQGSGLEEEMKKTILTGDRPTGKLHVGHYVGSLKRRVELQNSGINGLFSCPNAVFPCLVLTDCFCVCCQRAFFCCLSIGSCLNGI